MELVSPLLVHGFGVALHHQLGRCCRSVTLAVLFAVHLYSVGGVCVSSESNLNVCRAIPMLHTLHLPSALSHFITFGELNSVDFYIS